MPISKKKLKLVNNILFKPTFRSVISQIIKREIMVTLGGNETAQVRHCYEWLNNLAMCRQQLEYLENRINTKNDRLGLDASIELEALQELVTAQLQNIEDLTVEVAERLYGIQSNQHSASGVIVFSEALKGNALREKIRRAEHSVFYLKHNVYKLLSIAS